MQTDRPPLYEIIGCTRTHDASFAVEAVYKTQEFIGRIVEPDGGHFRAVGGKNLVYSFVYISGKSGLLTSQSSAATDSR